MDIDAPEEPQRESNMTAYEIMLSESQERMLLIVRLGQEAQVQRIFEKWDLHAVKIGQVTEDALLRVRNAGEVVAEIPNKNMAATSSSGRIPPAAISGRRDLMRSRAVNASRTDGALGKRSAGSIWRQRSTMSARRRSTPGCRW